MQEGKKKARNHFLLLFKKKKAPHLLGISSNPWRQLKVDNTATQPSSVKI